MSRLAWRPSAWDGDKEKKEDVDKDCIPGTPATSPPASPPAPSQGAKEEEENKEEEDEEKDQEEDEKETGT